MGWMGEQVLKSSVRHLIEVEDCWEIVGGQPSCSGQAEMAVPLEEFFAAPLGLGKFVCWLATQHWRAGLNSSPALRALDPHAFGHWSWAVLGSGRQPEMAAH